jgi:glucosamine-6-phosphate deaminase
MSNLTELKSEKKTVNLKLSKVEQAFHDASSSKKMTTKIPYVLVDNFPKLGLFTALRFLEWVIENPEGVVSLPTGKTPEFFIKWTQYLLENWNNPKGQEILNAYGLKGAPQPTLGGLHFVQLDEFLSLIHI